MAQQTSPLVTVAQDAEDAATGLHVFRESLPRYAIDITAIIAGLFAISSSLRRLVVAESDPHLQPSFYRIRQDVAMLLQSLQASINDIFNMFRRSRARSRQIVWEDLQHKMASEEGLGLLGRLECYRIFLQAQFQIVSGAPPHNIIELKRQIRGLRHAQGLEEVSMHPQMPPPSLNSPGARTPRPPRAHAGPPPAERDTPRSPVMEVNYDFEDWIPGRPRPPVPTPPLRSPQFASSPSPTLSSSYTSYSTGPVAEPAVHWSQRIYNGSNPATRFLPQFQLREHPFDGEDLRLRLYVRLPDLRTRVFVMTTDRARRVTHFCIPIANLKVIRDRSCLKLCRARVDGSYEPWVILNFVLYERMVLFYCTFVAMKYQDQRGLPEESLHDRLELESPNGEGEELIFGGIIQHGSMLHALRLFRDTTSYGVRIEASALRGVMKDVPIWTAFVTRYATDPDHVQYEGKGFVSLIALRTPPYVFLPSYEPLRSREGQYLLGFTTSRDGKQFIEAWAGLCRSQPPPAP
ncbi:hypothetical protein LTR62_003990 [Meristemomyces frigidus]|uniref:Uncharacterized protein n=1 Tax=Meristemomyces frigidus TaxID=1508187 RepID=A0AAN7TJ82_9PEZI|nr:hypothetical protein LTR62_003990 [Meristemomyces frigidus]